MDAHSVSSASRFSSSSSSVISTSRNKPNNRIGSKMNIALSVLPSFIKVDPGRRMTVKIQRQDSPDERTPSPLHKRNDSFEKASLLRSLNRSKTFGKKLNFFEGMLEEYQDYIDYLRTETEKNKPVMKINNILLTAQDFLSIIDPVKFTRTALDACLTLMKKLNYEALTRDEAHSNITVSSTAFAWKIFNEEKFEDLHAPSYIFPYK